MRRNANKMLMVDEQGNLQMAMFAKQAPQGPKGREPCRMVMMIVVVFYLGVGGERQWACPRPNTLKVKREKSVCRYRYFLPLFPVRIVIWTAS